MWDYSNPTSQALSFFFYICICPKNRPGFRKLLYKNLSVECLTRFSSFVRASGVNNRKSNSDTLKPFRVKEEAVPILWLTIDNRGVHYDASQIWVRHCFVQDESADAAEHNIIRSLTGATVCVCVRQDRKRDKKGAWEKKDRALSLSKCCPQWICLLSYKCHFISCTELWRLREGGRQYSRKNESFFINFKLMVFRAIFLLIHKASEM